MVSEPSKLHGIPVAICPNETPMDFPCYPYMMEFPCGFHRGKYLRELHGIYFIKTSWRISVRGTTIPVLGTVTVNFEVAGVPVYCRFLVSDAVDNPSWVSTGWKLTIVRGILSVVLSRLPERKSHC